MINDNAILNGNSIFQRYEAKFIVTPSQYSLLQKALSRHMVIDGYGLHTIMSVYFDTADFSIIRHSLDKPAFKEKLRLRSYGIPSAEDQVFIELKKKLKGVTYKRRVSLAYSQAKDYLYNGIAPNISGGQILSEIDWYKNQKQLEPKAVISYERLALRSLDGTGLRITFDHDLRWRQDETDLSKGDFGNLLLSRGERLMEVKTLTALPPWLCRALSAFEIFPVSFSKYGNVYTNYLINQWKEEDQHVG